MSLKKTTLSVHGMSCMGCVNNVKTVLGDVPGVKTVSVQLDTGPKGSTVTVEHEDKTPSSDLKTAVEEAGYEVKATH